jgi:hypothetical protein
MFLSKQGIRLPDPTGKIGELIRHEIFDPQEVNSLMWEDAIIWPIQHVALGFWISDSRKMDFSQYNSANATADFRWIGAQN